MKGAKMFSLFTLLYMVLGVIFAHARPASVINTGTSVSKCQIDEDCPDGKFCYKTRECASCRNCAKMGRIGPRDGNCARSMDECGPCTTGYKDKGNFCVLTSTEPIRPKSYNSTPTTDIRSPPSQTLMVYFGVAAVVFGIVIVLVFSLACFVKRRDSNPGRNIKRGLPERSKRRDSEREGLTSPSSNCDGSTDSYGASAPIEEEYLQAPYNFNIPIGHHSLLTNNQNQSRNEIQLIESRKQKALPFNAGNGSGEWAVRPVLPFGNHPINFGHQGNALDNQPPFLEPANDLPIDENLPDGAIVPQGEEGLVIEEGAIPGPNEGANNDNNENNGPGPINEDENLNGGVPQQPNEEGVLLQINFRLRAFLSRFSNNSRPEQSVNLNNAPPWVSNTQMDVMNPITNSNTSLDSGISSSAGEAVVVPSLETSFVEAQAALDNDVVMGEDV